MAKAAAPRHTARLHTADCPMSAKAVEAAFVSTLRESRAFSAAVLDFLKTRSPDAQARWAEASVEAGRVLFQPWSMEILFVLAVARRARFSELQSLLGGISSRTLSDKLQTLKGEGLVDRQVLDEQSLRIAKRQLGEATEGPRTSVRIEYSLTKEGLATAALATPLFARLSHRKM